jgi:hypothetical protein
MSKILNSANSFMTRLLAQPGVRDLDSVGAAFSSSFDHDEAEGVAVSADLAAQAGRIGPGVSKVRLDSGEEKRVVIPAALMALKNAVETSMNDYASRVRVAAHLPPLVEGAERLDSADGGYGRASDLIALTNNVIEEVRPDHDSFDIFPEDASTVRFGQKQHEIRFRKATASATFFNGSTDGFGDPTWSDESKYFPIRYIGAGLRINIFEAASAGILGDNALRTKMTLATQAVLDLENYVNWFGGGAEDLPGALTYPYLPRKVESVAFTVANAAASGGQAIFNAFRRSAQQAAHASRGAFRPDTVVMTQRLYDFLDATPMGTSTNHTGETVMDRIKKIRVGNKGTLNIKIADSLMNAGGTDVDGCLFLKSGAMFAKRVSVQGGLQASPMVKDSATSDHMVMFKGIGGVVMEQVGHNTLVYITVDPVYG